MQGQVLASVPEAQAALIPSDWRQPKFWRDLFLYFWVFSLVGHIIELIWGLIGYWFDLSAAPRIETIPIIAVAAPYGIGAVALLVFVYPFVKKEKLGVLATYVLSVLITTVVEFVSALLITLALGSNPFWDYSERFMNLFGFVCLTNSLAFGIGALVMLYVMFPWLENWRQKVNQRYLNIAAAILFPSYVAVQIIHLIRGL